MRTTGTVKWFDPKKGEGCVVSEGGALAALSRATLGIYGLKTISPGAVIVCEMKLTAEGLAVTAIYEIEKKPAEPRQSERSIADPPDQGAVRVKGTVKWFDPVKGFGVVISDDVKGDVLLHRSVVEAFGVSTLLEGAVIDCDVIARFKGHQVRRIRALLKQGMFAASPLPSPPTPGRRWPPRVRDIVLQEPTGPMVEAACKWFSRPKGYGYVVVRGGAEDVFVHMNLLRKAGIRELRQHQRVLVRIGRGTKGLTATEIALLPEVMSETEPRRPIPAHKAERKTGLMGKLLVVNEALGFGVIALPELDDVAVAGIALLRAAGALDPRTCGPLICDAEFVPPRLVIRCLTRVH